MSNNVKCPHCGKEVEITDALSHQIEERIKESLGEKHKTDLENLKKEIEATSVEQASKKFEAFLFAYRKH